MQDCRATARYSPRPDGRAGCLRGVAPLPGRMPDPAPGVTIDVPPPPGERPGLVVGGSRTGAGMFALPGTPRESVAADA